MAIDPRNLRRTSSQPTSATTSGEKKAPAQNQAAAPAPAPAPGAAPAPAPAPAGSPANQVAAVAQQRSAFAGDSFSTKPAASGKSNSALLPPVNSGHHVGGGNFFE